MSTRVEPAGVNAGNHKYSSVVVAVVAVDSNLFHAGLASGRSTSCSFLRQQEVAVEFDHRDGTARQMTDSRGSVSRQSSADAEKSQMLGWKRFDWVSGAAQGVRRYRY